VDLKICTFLFKYCRFAEKKNKKKQAACSLPAVFFSVCRSLFWELLKTHYFLFTFLELNFVKMAKSLLFVI
jgi:hypothetical protein